MSTAYNDRKTDELACDGNVVDFSFGFPIASTSDLQVNLIDSDGNVSTLTLDTDYTVNGTSWTSGGTITTTSTYDSGNYIQIIGATSPTQETSFPDLGNYSPRDEMDALDKLTRIAQEVKTLLSSALKVYPNLDVEYFVQTLSSGKFLRYYEGVIQSSDFSDSDIQSIIDSLSVLTDAEPYTYIGQYVNEGQEQSFDISVHPSNSSSSASESDTVASGVNVLRIDGVLQKLYVKTGTFSQNGGTLNTINADNVVIGSTTYYFKPLYESMMTSYLSASYAGSFEDAWATGKPIYRDIDVTLATMLSSINDNQFVESDPTKTLTLDSLTTGFTITHDSVELRLGIFNANSATYGVIQSGDHDLVTYTDFKGDVGHYVVTQDGVGSGCYQNKVLTGYSQTTPFVYQNATDAVHHFNDMQDYTGFGVQFRWCTRGVASNNTSRVTLNYIDLAATDGQSDYAFTLASEYDNYAVVKRDDNGNLTQSVTTSYSSGTLTVTLADTSITSSGGDAVIRLYYTNAKETYQINSGCDGVSFINNISDGTGDSNVVVGADYHYDETNGWELDAGSVVESDYPINTIVNGGSFENAFGSNIAINTGSATVINTKCKNAGLQYLSDVVHNCNIYANYGKISNNDCQVDADVIVNPAAIASIETSQDSYKVGDFNIEISNNKPATDAEYKQGRYFFGGQSAATTRRVGVNLVTPLIQYPDNIVSTIHGATSWTTIPTSTDFVTYSGTWARNTTDQKFGSACIETVAGSYGEITLDPGAIPGIMRVKFTAKGQCYVACYSNFSGGTSTNSPNINTIDEDDWTEFEFTIDVKNYSALSLHIGSDTGDTGYVQIRSIECNAY